MFHRPITKATVNREVTCLKTMLFFAVREKWLSDNPLRGYRLFPEHPSKTRVVTREEFERVYTAAGELLKPILIMAMDTVMRRGEILNLKWEDISLREGNIFVGDTKTGETRYIPISDRLKEALVSLRSGPTEAPVFQYKGRSLSWLKNSFNSAVKESGVERFTFHDFRHTFASNLVMAGVDISTVQELLGHKSISMTKRYSHPTPEHKRRAIKMLNMDTMDTYLDTKIKTIRKKHL